MYTAFEASCGQGCSEVFTTDQARVSPQHYVIQMCGWPITFPVLTWLFVSCYVLSKSIKPTYKSLQHSVYYLIFAQ